MNPIIVLTTVGENHAVRELAAELVEQRLAACVNIIPNIYSVFRWRGKVDGDYEQLLVIKTSEERVDALREVLFGRHPYEVPEFIVIPIDRIEGAYREWLLDAVSAG
jgi:periplasmic divalent cation tolerance protein